VFAFQIAFDSLFSISDGARQFHFCQIVRVQALDVTFMRTGNGLLRLDHLKVVGYAGVKRSRDWVSACSAKSTELRATST
jgi:hypothetical protein